MKKYKITKNFLIKEYVKNEKSQRRVAKELNCSAPTVANRLKKYNIHVRNINESCKGKHYSSKTEFKKGWNKGQPSAFKGHKHTQLACEKISKAISGNKNGMFGKPTPHGKKLKYNNTWMRSTWEVKYAKYLDKNNIKWLYESKRFDLGKLTYLPDFYLPEKDLYIEIKGWFTNKAKKRFKLFKKLYPNIKIKLLMYEDLKFKKILK